jgi:atypical dual specificity phosphatase
MANWFDSVPMSKVTELLYIGNNGNGAHLIDENLLDIRAVLNVGTELPYHHHPDIQYCSIEFHDGIEIPECAFKNCMAFLHFQEDLGRRTLVHCAAGISRSPSIVAAYLFHSKKVHSLDEAFFCVRLARGIVHPHPLIVRSIKKHLKVWPYDGSMGNAIEETKSIQSSEFIEMIRKHPDPLCAVRMAFGEELAPGIEFHQIVCTCGQKHQ